MQNQVYPTIPPAPKKPLPKILIYLAIGLVVILVIFFLTKLLTSGRGKVSNEIVWWGLWEDASIVNPIIAEYQQKNPKVKIKYMEQSKEDYRERLTNALAKGVGPDIFRFHNSWVPMFKNQLDVLPAEVMSASDYAKTFFPSAARDLSSGAGLVGIPLGYDSLTLYINEEIFSKEGKVPPVTWDDLRATAISLTHKDEKGQILQSGVALGRTENVDHWQEILALMMLQNGVDLTQVDKCYEKPASGTELGFKTCPAADALTFFILFSTIDGVWDVTLPSSTAAFAGGKLAMYFAPSWRAFEIKQNNPSLNFKTVPLPQLPKTSPNDKGVYYASYWAEGVWNKSKNKKAAWDFLKFLSSKETLEKLYQNASKIRSFGEPYPRVDMLQLLADHPILGSIVTGSADSQSWYLQSRTFDGPTGINSLVGKYFEDAVNAVNQGKEADKALETASQGVQQILAQYGLTSTQSSY